VKVSELLPLPRRNHAGDGLTENQLWAVDDFDAADPATLVVVKLNPRDLAPTQDEISLDNLRELMGADARGAALPPIKVVRVGSELRILDGHHRACVAALLSRTVSAVVLDIGNESARVKA
jgi:ParB-like chromosome segregation protein Spo0J